MRIPDIFRLKLIFIPMDIEPDWMLLWKKEYSQFVAHKSRVFEYFYNQGLNVLKGIQR